MDEKGWIDVPCSVMGRVLSDDGFCEIQNARAFLSNLDNSPQIVGCILVYKNEYDPQATEGHTRGWIKDGCQRCDVFVLLNWNHVRPFGSFFEINVLLVESHGGTDPSTVSRHKSHGFGHVWPHPALLGSTMSDVSAKEVCIRVFFGVYLLKLCRPWYAFHFNQVCSLLSRRLRSELCQGIRKSITRSSRRRQTVRTRQMILICGSRRTEERGGSV